ncbi:MAG: ABC transporter permease [Pelosinus sp.]|nr:ABC transporter permease [Pelosinus sp.]
MNWWHICKRELKDIFIKDPRRIGFIFGASLAYLFIFGLLYAPHVVKNVPLIIYNEDQSQLSRALVQALADSERLQIVGQPASEEEMQMYLHEKKAYAAIHIPHDFAQNVMAGRSSPVLMIVDGSNLLITNTVTTTIQEIIVAFSQPISTKLTETAGLLPTLAHNKSAPVQYNLRVLNNPTFSYLNFFVLGLAMAAFQQGVFLPIAASIIGEYKRLPELAGIHPAQVFLGKLLPYFVLCTISFFLTLFISIKAFDIPCKGSLLNLLYLSTAFILTAMGMSSLVASFCKSEITFTKLSLTYAVPAFTISGYIWPLQSMDAFNQFFAYTFPMLYLADTVRDIMVAGYAPLFYRNITVLSLAGICLILLSAWVYARKRRQLVLAAEKNSITAS